jgi:hypothetical protein
MKNMTTLLAIILTIALVALITLTTITLAYEFVSNKPQWLEDAYYFVWDRLEKVFCR